MSCTDSCKGERRPAATALPSAGDASRPGRATSRRFPPAGWRHAHGAGCVTVLIGLSAALCWASVNVLLSPLSRRFSMPGLVFWLLAFNMVITGTGAVVLEANDRVPVRGVAVAAAAGLIEVVGTLAWLRALRVGAVAIVSPIIGLEGGFASLIAIGFGADVTLAVAVGLTLAVAGGALTAAEGRTRTAAGAVWATVSAASFGTMFVLYAHTAPLGPLTTVAVAHASALVVIAPLVIARGGLRAARTDIVRLVVSGGLDGFGFCLFAIAVARGPVPVAAVCAAQFSTLGALLGIIWLRDRPRRHQYVGIAAAAIGTAVIGAYS
jgi:drug/metabolite transporter (DMT)-like permease